MHRRKTDTSTSAPEVYQFPRGLTQHHQGEIGSQTLVHPHGGLIASEVRLSPMSLLYSLAACEVAKLKPGRGHLGSRVNQG